MKEGKMDNYKKNLVFEETQRLSQKQIWFGWLVLIACNALFFYGVYKQIIIGQAFGNNPMSDKGLLITTGILLVFSICVMYLSYRSYLYTQITKEKIKVLFFPFHLKCREYDWEQISKAYIRKYNPVLEYGGWGIRYSRFRLNIGSFVKGFKAHQRAFNVSGNIGLQLEFVNGDKLLIGTQQWEELNEALKKLGKLSSGEGE
jgi:hypothetical protein